MGAVFCATTAVLPHSNGHGGSGYVNSEPALQAAREADAGLPKGLLEACLNTGRTPTAGEVKMIYSTKVPLLGCRCR